MTAAKNGAWSPNAKRAQVSNPKNVAVRAVLSEEMETQIVMLESFKMTCHWCKKSYEDQMKSINGMTSHSKIKKVSTSEVNAKERLYAFLNKSVFT